MTVLASYFDDSGSEGLGPVFVLSGYVAPLDKWRQFSREWSAALSEKPAIAYLKMRHANSLRGEFWGWPADARNAKLDRLSEVIINNVSLGVTSAVFWEDWLKVTAEFPDIPLVPYDFLYHGTMAVTTHFVMKNFPKRSKIDFIFDEQEGAGVRAASSFALAKRWMEPRELEVLAGCPTQGDEKVLLPLQAADLIAWQTRRFVFDNREAATGLEPPNSYVINSPTSRRLESISTVYNTYGLERLRSMIEEFAAFISMFPDEFSYLTARNDAGAPFKLVRHPFRPWERQ